MAPEGPFLIAYLLLRLADLDRLHTRLCFLPSVERDGANLRYDGGRGRRLLVNNLRGKILHDVELLCRQRRTD